MRRAGTLPLLAGVLAFGLAAEARGDAVVEFTGSHPIDPALAKGMCFLEGPHVHSYRPHREALYVQVPAGYAFVGDPVEFAPDAPKHGYYGHHPLFWLEGGEHYCYISGPHYHWQAPPAALGFKLKGGVYWYVGKQPKWYKARRHDHLDHYYRAVVVPHPVVTVAPPVGFAGVVLAAPGVVVQGPSIHLGLPGLVVGGPHHHGKVKVKAKHGGHGWGHFKGRGRGRWK